MLNYVFWPKIWLLPWVRNKFSVLKLVGWLGLRRKSGRSRAVLDLARKKKESETTAPKVPPLFVENYYWTLNTNSGTELKARKISQQMGFVTRFLNEVSQEIKVKLNESRQLKFYQVKQVKKKFNRDFS